MSILKEFKKTDKAMKDVYCDLMMEMAEKDDKIVLLDSDLMSSLSVMPFAKKFPDRAINCGIQEANMIGVAAGLSAVGFVPFTHTFGCFASRRCMDQIHISAAYARLNVKMVGSDPGITSAYNGGTHQAKEDMAVLRCIPNITLVEPVDKVMLKSLLPQIKDKYGVCYIRLNRKMDQQIFEDGTEFELGKGVVAAEGNAATIVASGIMLEQALAARAILAGEGMDVRVVCMHTWKPIDKELLVKCAEETGAIVTAENHTVTGGLGSAVSDALLDTPVRQRRIGIQDRFGEVGDVSYLLKTMKMTAKDIANAVREVKK